MKKILSLTLVLVLVLGSFPMAFADNHMASDFSDVEDEDVANAVNRLSAFGIVDGYDDGTYKPDNMVSRAEFAKLLVTALGLENAANAATGTSEFTDVTGNEWYAGFVNVAAGQGIVGGYPDGSFKPNTTVNYGEAVTMLVRALGYKDEFLPGSWPSNYVSKAASLDITDDVTFYPTGESDRGSVAVLVNNTLDANIIEQSSFGDDNNWSEQPGDTLLTENLDFEKFDNDEIVSAIPRVAGSLDDDQFKIAGITKDAESEMVLEKAEMLFGKQVVYYTDNDDDVVYIEESSEDKSKVVYGTIDTSGDYFANASFDEDEKLDVVFADGSDDSYEIDSNAALYVDNEEFINDDSNTELDLYNDLSTSDKTFGRFVINSSGDISLIDVNNFDMHSGIVTDADDDQLEYFDADENEEIIEADDYDVINVVDTEGNMIAMEDLEEGMLLYFNAEENDGSALENKSTEDELLNIVAVDNTVDTEATKWKSDEFEIDDEDYDVASDATVSSDDNDNVENYTSSNGADALNDLTGADAEVDVTLDIQGDVRHVVGNVDGSSDDKYGFLVGNEQSFDSTEIKILASDEEVYTYDVDFTDADFFAGSLSGETDTTGWNDYDNAFVKYTLNSDGEVDTILEIADLPNDANTQAGAAFDNNDVSVTNGLLRELTDDFESNKVETDTIPNGTLEDYIVSDDVVAFDLYAGYNGTDDIYDAEDVSVYNYDDLVDEGNTYDVVIYTDSDGEVIALGVIDDIASDDYDAGYVLDKWSNDGDTYIEILLQDGTIEEYEVDMTANGLEDEVAVSYAINTDGTIDIYDCQWDADGTAGFNVTVGFVEDVDGDYLDIQSTEGSAGTATSLKEASDTIYYEEDSELDFYDIDENDYVMVISDGKFMKSVQRFDLDKANSSNEETEDFLNAWNYHENGGTTPGAITTSYDQFDTTSGAYQLDLK